MLKIPFLHSTAWKVSAGDIYEELLLAKNPLADKLVGAQTKGALKHYGYVGD